MSKTTFFKEHLWATASKQVTAPLQCLQTARSLISSCRRTSEIVLNKYWQNPKITANSHHHCHYYHFHYHCKMHLYRLKILLTKFYNNILYCNMIPCLLQLNFVFFLPVCIFLLLYYTFRFLRTVKGVTISLRPSDIV